jgi:hypothetical protein
LVDLTPTPAFPLTTETPTVEPTPSETPTVEPVTTPSITPIATPTRTPTRTPCPAPKIIAFSGTPTTIITGQSATLSWNVSGAEIVSINQGIGAVAGSGTRLVSPAISTPYTLSATSCGGTVTKQATVTVQTIPLVSRSSPANGWVLRVVPRAVTFTWSAIGSPAGLKYDVEIEYYAVSSWKTFVTAADLTGTSYSLPDFKYDQQGRWRVWATAPGATEGPRGDWWYFSFNTLASQYVGTWNNENSSVNNPARIRITSGGGQVLNFYVDSLCGKALYCLVWSDTGYNYKGEPIDIGYVYLSDRYSASMKLYDAAGTRLRVTYQVGISRPVTYYFRRA